MGVKKNWIGPAIIVFTASFIWLFYWKFLTPGFLTFSDAAKFADIARNFVSGNGLGAGFAPFDNSFLNATGLLPLSSPPLFPLLISISFKLFGVSDFSVLLVSGIFYLSTAVCLYFLGKKLFGNLAGFLSSLTFIFDAAILNFATSGANESLFIFGLVFTALMFLLNKRWSLVLGFIGLVSLYFTRQSALIYILSFLLLYILIRFKETKKRIRASAILIFIYLILEVILNKFSRGLFVYSPLSVFLYGAEKFSPSVATTATLRGGMSDSTLQVIPLVKKIFYDLYNFYKLLPQIFSPYLFALFLLSFIKREKENSVKIFKFVVIFMVAVTFLTAAATLPIYRYLHPVIPFIYLLGAEMLVFILNQVLRDRRKVALVAFSFVLIFIGGQTLGKIFLDSRFSLAKPNTNQASVYVKLSWLLRENTQPNDLIITNLDAWGTWYGERKTIWYPLEPKQLEASDNTQRVDAVYLTSYKMDDENYYMGDSWRQAFLDPENIKDEFLVNNFKAKNVFEIKADETFENVGARAVLLIRK